MIFPVVLVSSACSHGITKILVEFLVPDQRCALAVPSESWHLTFLLGLLENLNCFHINHMLDTLDFTGSELQANFCLSCTV